MDTLCKELSSSDLGTKTASYDLNDLVECYNDTLKSALDRRAPVINKTVTKRPTVLWFTMMRSNPPNVIAGGPRGNGAEQSYTVTF